MERIIHPGGTDLTSGSLHCVDWGVGCRPTGHPSIQAEGKVVKAKAFTKKR